MVTDEREAAPPVLTLHIRGGGAGTLGPCASCRSVGAPDYGLPLAGQTPTTFLPRRCNVFTAGNSPPSAATIT